MSQEEIQFINQFQVAVITPMQSDLTNRKHRNWEKDPFSMDIEEIICSLSILSLKNGEFDLTYICRGDITEASYRPNGPIEHVDHCLWELQQYLKLCALQHGGLLPINSEIDHLIKQISKLLQIVNPNHYGKFSNSFM